MERQLGTYVIFHGKEGWWFVRWDDEMHPASKTYHSLENFTCAIGDDIVDTIGERVVEENRESFEILAPFDGPVG